MKICRCSEPVPVLPEPLRRGILPPARPAASVKRLIVVPIIHNAADLGSLADSVRAHYVQRFGPAVWQQRQQAVRDLWQGIAEALDALNLDYRRVRIYQDGLPVCGKEEQIVRELAEAGSLNHQLVRDLLGRGAVLEGTEDPQLLIREYQLQRRRLGAAGGQTPYAAGKIPRRLQRGRRHPRRPRPLHRPADRGHAPGRRNRAAVPGSGASLDALRGTAST